MNKKIKIFNTVAVLTIIALAYAGCPVVGTQSSSSTSSGSSNNNQEPPPPPPPVKIKPQVLLSTANDPEKTADELYQTYENYKQTNLSTKKTKAEQKEIILPLIDSIDDEESFLLKLSENPTDETNLKIIKDIINAVGADELSKTKNGPKVIDRLFEDNKSKDVFLYCFHKGCSVSATTPEEIMASALDDNGKDQQMVLMLNNDKTQLNTLRYLTQKTDDADLNAKKNYIIKFYNYVLKKQVKSTHNGIKNRAAKKQKLFPKKLVDALAYTIKIGDEVNLTNDQIEILDTSNVSLAPIVLEASRNFTTNSKLNLPDELIELIAKQNTDLTPLLKAMAYNISLNRKVSIPDALLTQIAHQQLDLTLLLNDKRLKEGVGLQNHIDDVQAFLRKLKNKNNIPGFIWNKMVEGLRKKLKAKFYDDKNIEKFLLLENPLFAELEENFSNKSDVDFAQKSNEYLGNSPPQDLPTRANKLADLLLTSPELTQSSLQFANDAIKTIIENVDTAKAKIIQEKILNLALEKGNLDLLIDFNLNPTGTFQNQYGELLNFLQIIVEKNQAGSMENIHTNAQKIKQVLGNENEFKDYLSQRNGAPGSILETFSGKEGAFITQDAAFEFFNQANGEMDAFDQDKIIPYFTDLFDGNNPALDFLEKFALIKDHIKGEANLGFKDRLIRKIPDLLTNGNFLDSKIKALNAIFEEVKDEKLFLQLECPSIASNSCLELFVKNFETHISQLNKNRERSRTNQIGFNIFNSLLMAAIKTSFYLHKNNNTYKFADKKLLIPLLKNYYLYIEEDEAISTKIKSLVDYIFLLPDDKTNNQIKLDVTKVILDEEKNPDRISYFNNLPAFNRALAMYVEKEFYSLSTTSNTGWVDNIAQQKINVNNLLTYKITQDKTSQDKFYVDLFSNDYAGTGDTLLILLLRDLHKEHKLEKDNYNINEPVKNNVVEVAKILKSKLPIQMTWRSYRTMQSKNGLTIEAHLKQILSEWNIWKINIPLENLDWQY